VGRREDNKGEENKGEENKGEKKGGREEEERRRKIGEEGRRWRKGAKGNPICGKQN
jgi:hypothetical protein